jgi:steroid delta-isomerase-like uncharacterized protein
VGLSEWHTPVGVVESYLRAFADADAAAIAAHVSDGFVNEHTSALGDGSVGRAAYQERLAGFLASFPDLRYDIEDLVADGDRVVAAYRMTATHEGHAIDIRGVMRFGVTDGRIACRVDYWDSLVFLRQIGAAP